MGRDPSALGDLVFFYSQKTSSHQVKAQCPLPPVAGRIQTPDPEEGVGNMNGGALHHILGEERGVDSGPSFPHGPLQSPEPPASHQGLRPNRTKWVELVRGILPPKWGHTRAPVF